MLTCSKCGNENELGHVFCRVCGTKLDLRDMTSEEVAKSQKQVRIVGLWKKILVGVAVAVVLIVGFALWPKTNVIGKKGTNYGKQRVERQIKMLRRLKPGRSQRAVFSEKDINGYFEFSKVKKTEKIDSFSVAIMQGYFRVQLVRNLGSLGVWKFRVEPKISYDLVCVPVGGTLVVSKAMMGHLSLWGPARTSVVRAVYRFAVDEKDRAAFKRLAEIKATEGKVSVLVKK